MLQQSGERPGHEYAQSISLQATTAGIQQAMVKGAKQEHIKTATELSLKNAQTSVK